MPFATCGSMECVLTAMTNVTGLKGSSKPALERGLSEALAFEKALQLPRRAKSATPQPLWLEFGANTGGTTRLIAAAGGRGNRVSPVVHSFDSFLGLPEDWRTVQEAHGTTGSRTKGASFWTKKLTSRGSFNRNGHVPFQDPRVFWEVGWYNETLPKFLAARPDATVSFVHVDCDLYSSTHTVFTELAPRLLPGAVIVFDELLNYPEFAAHEMRALVELLEATGRRLEAVGVEADEVSSDEASIRSEFHRKRSDFRNKCAAVVRVW